MKTISRLTVCVESADARFDRPSTFRLEEQCSNGARPMQSNGLMFAKKNWFVPHAIGDVPHVQTVKSVTMMMGSIGLIIGLIRDQIS